MRVEFIVRLLGAAAGAIIGWRGGLAIAGTGNQTWVWGLAAVGFVIGLLITPYVTYIPFKWLWRHAKIMPVSDLFVGGLGLIVALVASALVAVPLSMLPDYFGRVLPFIVSIAFVYFGVSIMITRRKEIMEFMSNRRLPGREGGKQQPVHDRAILLDTSAIIDGRIADISKTGFVDGVLLVPRFVLEELQKIADSADPLRRNRGRRGLDMLNRLQKESTVPVRVSDMDANSDADVDSKLVTLAKLNGYPIATNDYNLNRVAELQGIRVLNVNELANAVKPVVLPGEEMLVHIIQEGKELGQGVGYLDDGTMIVVENGKRRMNLDTSVVVTRVLQTVAGRMIFAHPKGDY
jgi:uncharacterized protein YacL